jgi:ABC-type xylose transport system permease subunit
MTSSTRSRFVSASVFAINGILAAFSAVTVASVLVDNPKGPDAAGQAVALIVCAGLAGTCLTLAAAAATDPD